MNSIYLVPLLPQAQTIAGRSIQIDTPKYLALVGMSFTSIPFGGEPMCILVLSAPNAALESESDVYSFPSDLTSQLSDTAVATLSAFLTDANVPVSQIQSGMTFAATLQAIARIFLACQALHGVSGAPIFTAGVTLTTTIADSDLAPLGTQEVSSFGPFDFSSIKSSDSVGDVLDSLSKQITQNVNFGSL